MGAMFWLLGCVLAPDQGLPRSRPAPPPSAVWNGEQVLTPRLGRGQELVYRGVFTEQANGPRVQLQRAYRLETRFFVLDTPPRGVGLAVFTTLQNRSERPASGIRADPISTSVRLERLSLDLQGKIAADPAVSLQVPLEGAPTLEVGAWIDMPRGKSALTQGWEIVESGRPATAWRLVGTETVDAQTCMKLIGVQQTPEWERPRADRGAWRRQDTVWVASRTGITVRVERIIEHREPACRETAQKSVLRYDLESNLPLPAQLAQDRRQDILQTFAFREAALPMLRSPIEYRKSLETLHRRIKSHLENHPTTPYREAMLLLKRQVESGLRGEVLQVVHQEADSGPKIATVGAAAPDFLATECTGPGAATLARWKGKPILLVFYHPSSTTAASLLRFCQEMHAAYGRWMSVVGLSVVDDTAQVVKQRTALKLGFPILYGGGMRISYAVETTPKLILIDSAGVVRGAYLGWGQETPTEVLTELRRWLPK